jgi:ketosteroid isomerase-like protein
MVHTNATYAWFMEMHDGKITKVTAFLDNIKFANVMKLVPPQE